MHSDAPEDICASDRRICGKCWDLQGITARHEVYESKESVGMAKLSTKPRWMARDQPQSTGYVAVYFVLSNLSLYLGNYAK